MKFAHLADIHLGSWRDPKLRELNIDSFVKAVDVCISERVDFVLIAGDLFNTAVPDIDTVKYACRELKRLKDHYVPVYVIAGSHDFSASGKTMLDVLEHAGLLVNVARGDVLEDNSIKLKFTTDKSGVNIVGLPGRKGGLDKEYYKSILVEPKSGFKIFMFHNALSELKPKDLAEIDSLPVSLLPSGFDYYAGGHVHVVDNQLVDSRRIVFPGPVFPNNFSELEKLKCGSFVIFDNSNIRNIPLPLKHVVSFCVDADNKSVSDVSIDLKNKLNIDVKDCIVLIRISGILCSGRPSDLLWNEVFSDLNARNAFVVLRNTFGFSSKEFEFISVNSEVDVEDAVLREHAGQFKLSDDDLQLTKSLMQVLSIEKLDGERVSDFESRLFSELDKLF